MVDNAGMHSRQGLRGFLILVALTAPIAASADTYQVDSIAALQTKANPGTSDPELRTPSN